MANSNTLAQFILQQQQFITHQQHFLEKLILNMEDNQKVKQLEDEVKGLKIELQHQRAYINKQSAQLIREINILKGNVTANQDKIQSVYTELSFCESSSQILENIPNTSPDPNDNTKTVGEVTRKVEGLGGGDAIISGEMDEL